MGVAHDRQRYRRFVDLTFHKWERDEQQGTYDDGDYNGRMLPAQVYRIIQSKDQQAGASHESGHTIVIKSTCRIPVKVWDDQEAQHTGNTGQNEVHPEH